MKIEKFKKIPTVKKESGRPAKYPFKDLKPKQRLLIDVDIYDPELESKILSDKKNVVKTALSQYTQKNAPDWETEVLVEGKQVIVYRTK